jgi:hypothetical protein
VINFSAISWQKKLLLLRWGFSNLKYMSKENGAGRFWLEGSVYRIIGKIWFGL